MATEASPEDFSAGPSFYASAARPRALFDDQSESKVQRFCASMTKLCRGLQTFIFLGTLGALTALCALAVRTTALFGERVRDSFLTATPTLDDVASDVVPRNCSVCFHMPQTIGFQLLGWSAYTTMCVGCALIGVVFTWISPQSSGSGIPRMKSALSGIYIHRFLGAMTLVMKMLGMLMVRVSGLAVGQEVRCNSVSSASSSPSVHQSPLILSFSRSLSLSLLPLFPRMFCFVSLRRSSSLSLHSPLVLPTRLSSGSIRSRFVLHFVSNDAPPVL